MKRRLALQSFEELQREQTALEKQLIDAEGEERQALVNELTALRQVRAVRIGNALKSTFLFDE